LFLINTLSLFHGNAREKERKKINHGKFPLFSLFSPGVILSLKGNEWGNMINCFQIFSLAGMTKQ
jgi:hypothetical protein